MRLNDSNLGGKYLISHTQIWLLFISRNSCDRDVAIPQNIFNRRYRETSWWSGFWNASEQVSKMHQTGLKQMLTCTHTNVIYNWRSDVKKNNGGKNWKNTLCSARKANRLWQYSMCGNYNSVVDETGKNEREDLLKQCGLHKAAFRDCLLLLVSLESIWYSIINKKQT